VPGATLRYTVLRLGIFAVCLIVARAVGAVGWLALLIAAVVSVLLSLVLLRRQREQMAAALQQRVDTRIRARQDGTAKKSRFGRGLDEDNAAED
jgi:mannitol-specific phosphotransferase system IIBC component